MRIDADNMHFQVLNQKIREASDADITVDNCLGQRYIGSGQSGKHIVINGTPGNALGAYLDDSDIVVNGNAQDATGDTMNSGKILIHGSSGDATGYAMRGGKIFIRGNAGYRAGIHMKEYREQRPVLVIGGCAGSFLGEYQAGGIIIVLAIDSAGPSVGRFCATGMHGGKMFICTDEAPYDLPSNVEAKKCTDEDLCEIKEIISEYCADFELDQNDILKKTFYKLTPDTKNPYKRLYTYN